MSQAHYVLEKRKEGWFISFERNRFGPFIEGPTSAFVAAVQAANQAGKDGHQAVVLQRAENGEVRTIWTHGVDPYPPSWVQSALLERTSRDRKSLAQRMQNDQGLVSPLPWAKP